MGSCEHAVRQGAEAASTGRPTGVGIPDSLENEAANRVPESQGSYPSPNVPEGCRGEEYTESLRRSEGGILPLRQERESLGNEEDEAGHASRDEQRPIVGDGDGGSESKKDAVKVSPRGSRDEPQTENAGIGAVDQDRFSNEGTDEKSSECFIDQRPCTSKCVAFLGRTSGAQCWLLVFADKLLVVLRKPGGGPQYPPPPKVF